MGSEMCIRDSYSVDAVDAQAENVSAISLTKVGVMPMPVDVAITLTSGEVVNYTIPLRMMRGAKSSDGYTKYEVAAGLAVDA